MLILEEPQEIYKTINNYPLQDETYKIIRICMEVHKQLGKGLIVNFGEDSLKFKRVILTK